MSVNVYNFRVPVSKGVPLPWMKWNTSLKRWLQTKYTSLKSFTFWKASVNVYNFRVPVHKGVPLPWMKCNLSFKDDCRPTILVWKVSNSEKCILNYTTLGSPFIRGFPSHGWNEYQLWKASLSEKWALNYTNLGFPFIRGFPSYGWSETHPLTMIAGQVYEFEECHFLKSVRWTIQL